MFFPADSLPQIASDPKYNPLNTQWQSFVFEGNISTSNVNAFMSAQIISHQTAL